jgi:hypothetical protein
MGFPPNISQLLVRKEGKENVQKTIVLGCRVATLSLPAYNVWCCGEQNMKNTFVFRSVFEQASMFLGRSFLF